MATLTRLSGQQVNEIRRRWIAAEGQPNTTALREQIARDFGLSRSVLWRLAKLRGWPRAHHNR